MHSTTELECTQAATFGGGKVWPAPLVSVMLCCAVCRLQVQKYLERFISDLQDLFEKYKKTAGYAECELVIL